MDFLPSVDELRDHLVAHDRAVREIMALGKFGTLFILFWINKKNMLPITVPGIMFLLQFYQITVIACM